MKTEPATTDDRGSSPVEFVLVGALLTFLTLGVLQLGLAIYVRNVVHDAAVEGAYHAALADTSIAEGQTRTIDVVARTVGQGFASEVVVEEVTFLDHPAVAVTVRTPLPVIGLWGLPATMEVTAHAPMETFD